MKQYLKNILIALDQLGNVILIAGYPDETVSAECWRRGKTSAAWNAARIIVDRLFWFDPQHCFTSYLSEFARKQLPKEYSQ